MIINTRNCIEPLWMQHWTSGSISHGGVSDTCTLDWIYMRKWCISTGMELLMSMMSVSLWVSFYVKRWEEGKGKTDPLQLNLAHNESSEGHVVAINFVKGSQTVCRLYTKNADCNKDGGSQSDFVFLLFKYFTYIYPQSPCIHSSIISS